MEKKTINRVLVAVAVAVVATIVIVPRKTLVTASYIPELTSNSRYDYSAVEYEQPVNVSMIDGDYSGQMTEINYKDGTTTTTDITAKVTIDYTGSKIEIYDPNKPLASTSVYIPQPNKTFLLELTDTRESGSSYAEYDFYYDAHLGFRTSEGICTFVINNHKNENYFTLNTSLYYSQEGKREFESETEYKLSKN